MNLIQKYLLYLKLINPGPVTSTQTAAHNKSITRIEWNYQDDKNTYTIISYSDKVIFWARVLLNRYDITSFSGRMARNLYNQAAAVMQGKSR